MPVDDVRSFNKVPTFQPVRFEEVMGEEYRGLMRGKYTLQQVRY